MTDKSECSPKTPILNFEEIVRIVRILTELGIREVRLTGGEPLERKDLPRLVSMLSATSGLERIALTTNGSHLQRQARSLVSNGVTDINIHLDSLNPIAHQWITGGDFLRNTLEGIEASLAANFRSVKLNAVLLRGINDNEAFDLISLAASRGIAIRFIELMPMGNVPFFKKYFMASNEVIDLLRNLWTLHPTNIPTGNGPARYYHAEEINADIGFISHSEYKFCNSCNRIRLLAGGTLKNCLGAKGKLSLAGKINQMSNQELANLIRDFILEKPANHGGFIDAIRGPSIPMHAIGG